MTRNYDLLWVKWRLDKVGFDCCSVYVYSVLYLASLLPVVTAIGCWYCFIVLASHVTFFHFFLLLLLLSFLAFCSLAWSLYPWMALSVFAHLSDECAVVKLIANGISDSIRGHHFHNPVCSSRVFF